MPVRTITTRLAIDGEKAFKEEMSSVNREMRSLREEMKLSEEQFRGQANTVDALTDKQKLLRKQIEQQEIKVRALGGALEDATVAYGETDKRTDDFRQSLTRAQRELLRMNSELQDTEKYLDEAKSSASGAADSIDKFGREAKEAGGGLKDMSLDNLIESVGNLKGLLAGGAIGLGVGALKELAGSVMSVEESTREWRKIMGGLEVSAAAAGYSARETGEAYDYLYGVLGDNQTTATTIANLQAIGLEQQDLMTLIDMTTGAWNKYGDSIPIDGLAESINETIRAGQITGTFADVINWGSEELNTFGVALKEDTEANKEWNEAVKDAKTSEDFFNLALQEAQTQAERANLVMQAMADQGLEAAGQAYRDVNEDIVAANDAQNELDKAWGTLGETIAPVADFLRGTLADALGTVNDLLLGGAEFVEDLGIVFSDLNDRINGWIDSWDFSGVYDWIGRINERMADSEWGNKPAGWENEHSAMLDAIPHKNGLDRVPYDGYLAELHRDEAVLTANEAALWRQLQSVGQRPAAQIAAPASEIPAQLQPTGRSAGEREIVINLTAKMDNAVVARAQYRASQDESARRGDHFLQ